MARMLVPDLRAKKRSSAIPVWPKVVAWLDTVYTARCSRCGRNTPLRREAASKFGRRCHYCEKSTIVTSDTGRLGWWAFNVSSTGDGLRLDGVRGPYNDMADAIIDYSRQLGFVAYGPVASA